FSPDSKLLVTDGLSVIDVATGQEVHVLVNQSRKNIYSITFSRDGKSIIAGEYANAPASVVIWDVLSGQEVRRLTLDTGFLAVAVSPDGKFLAVGSRDKVVRILDLTDGKVVTRLEGD